MDPAEPHPFYRSKRQFTPAAVRREAGEDPSLCYKRESTHHAGFGQHLGGTGEV